MMNSGRILLNSKHSRWPHPRRDATVRIKQTFPDIWLAKRGRAMVPGARFRKRLFEARSLNLKSRLPNSELSRFGKLRLFIFRRHVKSWFNQLWVRVTPGHGDLKTLISGMQIIWGRKRKPWSSHFSPLEIEEFMYVFKKKKVRLRQQLKRELVWLKITDKVHGRSIIGGIWKKERNVWS